MFNFEPSYSREVLFRKRKLWRNLTEEKIIGGDLKAFGSTPFCSGTEGESRNEGG